MSGRPRGYVEEVAETGPIPARSCQGHEPVRNGDSCFICGRLLPGEVGALTERVEHYEDRVLAKLASEVPGHERR